MTSNPAASTRSIAVIAGVILAGFAAFSLWVVYREGYLGFLSLAGRELWGMQMLIDLALAMVVATGWMIGDAKRRGISAWPFVVVSVFLGLIGVLAYLVRRAVA